ncbi:MBL fold metallo-hydrolase [Bacteroidetes bacterium endosymbiont of Geopemphigus sp.]|uniref:MBL fold metallo-hydrolase n=1 Tax=Bacteroidetes bacterium endosymbiont of Geopemphigus sp. TaxID=2047937 RepID=UPI000CD13EF9|nr:MBL fold metallo-hydrolase [Bacteroidetes bacterium endosymbiont of Geopemphigus sp.]
MRITFLGTGTSQGVPVIGCTHPVCLSQDPRDRRTRSSILIEKGNKNLLIDCGPDFRMQMLKNRKDCIDALLLTHEHNDHLAGLDDLRPIYFKAKKPIPVYALERVLEEVKYRFSYIFSEKKFAGKPELSLLSIKSQEIFDVEGFRILSLEVQHNDLFILGYRIGRFAYITDASFLPETTIESLKNIEFLVLNTLRIKPEHPSHFSLPQALNIIKKLSPEKTYLTHMSYEIGFHKDLIKDLPSGVLPAYDGLSIECLY